MNIKELRLVIITLYILSILIIVYPIASPLIARARYEEDAINKDKVVLDDDGRRDKSYHLNILQKIELKLLGSAKLGYERRLGWQEELPIYLFRCPRHGLQSSYTSGYGSMLLCPEYLRILSSHA
jgi:hypothetical protein